MHKYIKFIWDFRGPNASKTAEHHEIHLKDFLKIHALESHKTGVEQMSEFHYLAFMVVPENQMKDLRDRLKPHRGQVYS